MSALLLADIEACLGHVSEGVARRILATGATREELRAAAHAVGVGGAPRGQRGRIAEVCWLLVEEIGTEFLPDR